MIFYQDQHFVWICYTYPTGSFGTMDMKLKMDQLPVPLNLHVSAQVGEWPAGSTELEPEDPQVINGGTWMDG